MRWFWWCIALTLCLAGTAQQVQRQTWTTEEGLPQNSVHALLQSKDGYLWIATENGVARFNGLHFQRFFTGNQTAFSSNDVCCIAEQKSGTLLFGTATGLVSEQNDAFHRVDAVAGDVLAIQVETDGAALVLTNRELYRVRNDVAQPVPLPRGVTAMAMGPAANGSVLLAAGKELFRVGGAAVQRVGLLPDVPEQLAEDAQGHVWIATAGSVEVLRGSMDVARRWNAGEALPGSRVESLQPWPGGMLAGTSRGAALLHADRAAADLVPEAAGSAVLSAITDREGDAWFGTDSGGLFVLRERSVANLPAVAGESVTALASGADGMLWVGTRNTGLQRVSDGHVSPLSAQLASQVVLSLAAGDGGDVWVGSPEGLDHVAGGHVEHRTAADGLPDDFVRALAVSSSGTVWIGTRHGVAAMRDGRVERVLTQSDGLPSDVIGALLPAKDGTVWIGTVAGLVRWNGSTAERFQTENHARLAVASLLQTPDGTIWVGSSDGLYAVQGNAVQAVGGPALRTGVAALLADRFGNLWVRTSAGILRVSAAALLTCGTRPNCNVPERLFGVPDGMPSVELPALGSPIGVAGADGSLWFATRRGVAVVRPEPTAPAVAPGIAIEEASVDDHAVAFRPELEIGAGQRRVVITFAGLSLGAPAQVQYRSLLDGFDREWSPWGQANVADYTNLPPGRYVLRVQARSAEGAISAQDATVALRVRAPFYRRWWFYVVLLGMAGAVAYGLYWLRLRRIRRDYEAVLQERNRIAREIHDTLAQDFVAVSLQLEVTSQLLQAGAAAAAQEQIDATRTLVRDGIQDARESIWALRAGGSEETLPARLAAAVQRTEHATFLVTGAYRALPPSREREVYRIAKESLGNAARHSHASHIPVELLYSEDAVVLRVSDDGAGFDVGEAAELAGHYGVRGMRERAASMGATLTVQSAPGQGTRVELRLPAISREGA